MSRRRSSPTPSEPPLEHAGWVWLSYVCAHDPEHRLLTFGWPVLRRPVDTLSVAECLGPRVVHYGTAREHAFTSGIPIAPSPLAQALYGRPIVLPVPRLKLTCSACGHVAERNGHRFRRDCRDAGRQFFHTGHAELRVVL